MNLSQSLRNQSLNLSLRRRAVSDRPLPRRWSPSRCCLSRRCLNHRPTRRRWEADPEAGEVGPESWNRPNRSLSPNLNPGSSPSPNLSRWAGVHTG